MERSLIFQDVLTGFMDQAVNLNVSVVMEQRVITSAVPVRVLRDGEAGYVINPVLMDSMGSTVRNDVCVVSLLSVLTYNFSGCV